MFKVHAIHCFGDHDKILKYEILKNEWKTIDYHSSSAFRGEFKYTSVCRIAKTCDIVLTGGCSIINYKASNKAFRMNTEEGTHTFYRVANMNEA